MNIQRKYEENPHPEEQTEGCKHFVGNILCLQKYWRFPKSIDHKIALSPTGMYTSSDEIKISHASKDHRLESSLNPTLTEVCDNHQFPPLEVFKKKKCRRQYGSSQ